MAKKKSREVKEVKEEKEIKKFQINLVGDRLIAEDKHEAHNLYDQSRYGEIVDNKIQYSVVEGLYLLEKGRVDILNEKKKLKFDDFLKEAVKK